MNELTKDKLAIAKWCEFALVRGQSIHYSLQFMVRRFHFPYKHATQTIESVLNEWKQMAGVPVISVFERVDRMPDEVREALTKYIIKLESSN